MSCSTVALLIKNLECNIVTSVEKENTSKKWDIPWNTTRKRSITILYHTIENTVMRNTMGKLGVIFCFLFWVSCRGIYNGFSVLTGCIFYEIMDIK